MHAKCVIFDNVRFGGEKISKFREIHKELHNPPKFKNRRGGEQGQEALRSSSGKLDLDAILTRAAHSSRVSKRE